jgi:hypothetical protein
VKCIDILLAIEIVGNLPQRAADPLDLLVLLEIRLRPHRRGIPDVPALAVAQRIRKRLRGLSNDAVSFTFVYLEWTNLIDQLVQHVAEVERIEHPHAEVHREFETGLAAGRLDAVRLLEEQHTEAVEAGILQREAILGLIHAEAAWAARAGGKRKHSCR